MITTKKKTYILKNTKHTTASVSSASPPTPTDWPTLRPLAERDKGLHSQPTVQISHYELFILVKR